MPFRFGFFLMPNFTLIGLGSAVDPLRIANSVVNRKIYEFIIISITGGAVESSDGISIQADCSIEQCPRLDALLIVGPNPIPASGIDVLLRWLKHLGREGVALGGVDTGSYFLACAGLMDGYRCTIHWEDMDTLVEHFPRLIVSNKLFEIDRDRCSCSGGIAPLELMIQIIALGTGGRKLAVEVGDLLLAEHRGPNEIQRVPLRGVVSAGHPKLVEAVTLMESNIEEPLSMKEIAFHMESSARQLERLFRDNLKCTPTQYYFHLRLARARRLLMRTNRSVSDIAVACGFVSMTHFSSRYHSAFGASPREDRKKHGNERVEHGRDGDASV